jgi:hypothetical protein
MARYLKEDSDFAKRVENVMQALLDNNVEIEYLAGEFRFTDTSENAPECCKNMTLVDEGASPAFALPLYYYRLKVYE